MGFLSAIFGSPTAKAPKTPVRQVPVPAANRVAEPVEEEFDPVMPSVTAASLSDLSRGMLLQVTVNKGTPLLTGRITEVDGNSVTLERRPGQISFQTCEPGTETFVRGLTSASVPLDMCGVIEESTRMRCRIKGLELIPFNETRNYFRLSIRTPISLYDIEDKALENAEEAELVDVSVTGARFQSEYIHGEGELLQMKFQLDDYLPRVIPGEIVRITEEDNNKFQYGFLFAQLDDREINALTKELFNVQVGNKRVKMRNINGPGHW